ncbi:hypothetical protein [Lyngbya sp. CCY1209]|jgi:hypothetical protein|uniref:hypothetical protein n=1 Tax=Lyngbya sp. CCY1209 TaxID=2886103 RepID=UPI002D20311E|nr:hypothetical protein [Lyngbya sp. CCY1209]MEB3884612.1 hypothetical protein [Lyngbya sp. CCY1209]
MNLTTTAILLMSLSTLNSTQPAFQGVSTISATPELPAIQTANNVDDNDDDCDIVPPT